MIEWGNAGLLAGSIALAGELLKHRDIQGQVTGIAATRLLTVLFCFPALYCLGFWALCGGSLPINSSGYAAERLVGSRHGRCCSRTAVVLIGHERRLSGRALCGDSALAWLPPRRHFCCLDHRTEGNGFQFSEALAATCAGFVARPRSPRLGHRNTSRLLWRLRENH